MAPTILNVLDFGARPDLGIEASIADLQANRQSIQKAIDSILVWASLDILSPTVLSPSSPKAIGTVVRFPAGVYRIHGRLKIPFLQSFSLIGDGGVGGTAIVQHQDDEPILEFTKEDTWGWTIENLNFTWKNPQSCEQDHAIAINFLPSAANGDGYYHGVIERCHFANAYRGISITAEKYKFTVEPSLVDQVVTKLNAKQLPNVLSVQFGTHQIPFAASANLSVNRTGSKWTMIDDKNNRIIVRQDHDSLNVYAPAPLPVWETHIDHCVFSGCKGSAIYFSGGIGMPGNSISNTYIRNYTTPDGVNRENGTEAQLYLTGQNGMSLTSLDMEGSSNMVIYADSSILSINGLYLERLKLHNPKNPYFWIFYFADLVYDIRSLSFGSAESDPVAMAILICGGNGASIVVSGVHVQFETSKPFYLFGGRDPKNSFRLLGHYHHNPSDNLQLCLPDMVHLVTVDPSKVSTNLAFPTIAAGTTQTQTVTVTGARPGDIVSLGAPDKLQTGLLAFGLVTAPDTVEVRVLNTSTQSITPVSGIWTITIGGG